MTTSTPSPRPINVAAYLPAMAAAQPDALAVAVAAGRNADGSPRFEQMTAAQLDRRSDRIAHALHSVGIREGTRTVLMVKPSPDFFALTFAMLKIGAVFVMVDPGMGVANLGTCLAEAEPEAFVGIAKAHLARLVLRWASKSLRIKVQVGRRLPGAGHPLSVLEELAPQTPFPTFEPTDPEQTAAILFTSGSTGVPKGVITPHRVFAAQVQMLRDAFGIQPGERDLATFPLFALFGPALGMASVVPDMDASRPASAEPQRLVEAQQAFGCTNMFASPAVIDKLGRHCDRHGVRLHGLRRAISAGAPASIPAIERFCRALPDGVEVFTPYGATESLPVSVIGSDAILGETRARTESGAGVCVGRPVEGVDVAIIPITDEAIATWSDDLRLPPGEIGEIVVRGPMVTPGYYARPESTALAKIRDASGRTPTLRHRMGDVGYLDADGKLWMCGRKSHRVRTDQGPMFTIPCESPFNTHPAVFRTALVGVGPAEKQRPVLCVELEPDAKIPWERLERELGDIAARHEHTRSIGTFLRHPKFPVDVRHNSKIFREKLARWAQERVPA